MIYLQDVGSEAFRWFQTLEPLTQSCQIKMQKKLLKKQKYQVLQSLFQS